MIVSISNVMAAVSGVMFDLLVLLGFGNFFGPDFVIIPCC